MITLVSAMSRGRVIGKDGGLPWGRTMKTDQDRYKHMVAGKIAVIGRRTYDPVDSYLRTAQHIYLFTNQPIEANEHITPITSIKPVLAEAANRQVLVLGGASVFEQFIEVADQLELTYIDADIAGDRYFPAIDKNDWQVIHDESHSADEENKYNYRFVTLKRKNHR